ncbi:MAG: hypothetical protein ACI9OJ_001729 [Myxococcota bacterium]|jgi:hypothetical protein
MRQRHLDCAVLFGLLGLLTACANGDGRGFGTVSGVMTVSLDGTSFTSVSGESAEVTSITIGVLGIRIAAAADAPTEDETGELLAVLPIGAHWAPMAGRADIPYGPYEVERGDYHTLSVLISRVRLSIDVGGVTQTIEVTWPEGLSVDAEIELAVNSDRPPNIEMVTELVVDAASFDRVDFFGDNIRDELALGLARTGVINATWIRKAD